MIRLGLIGGGTSPEDADRLVNSYARNRPIAEVMPLATTILAARWLGADEAQANAPMRFYVTSSTLAQDPGELIAPRDWFERSMEMNGITDTYGFAETMLEEIEQDESPEIAMDEIAGQFEDIARMLRRISQEFYGLKDAASVLWENGKALKFALPVVDQKGAA